MKKSVKIWATMTGLMMSFTALLGMAACGDNGAPAGSEEITFWYDCGLETQSVYRELVQTYNKEQGAEDGVYVVGSRKTGISTSARTQITGGNPPNVIMISDEVFRSYALDG